ncbi:MAG: LPS-assembly protein LptD, partial [Pseudomonadota bacterium]
MRALLAILMLLASPLAAQDDEGPATLIADSVAVVEGDTLSATGNVEILQGETRLTASRVTYDGQNDRIIIEGPITVYDGESTVTLADQAELSEGLQNGILRGARLVLDQQLQVSAVEFQRVDGRYTQGFRVAATSCHVCQNGRAPLWQIRARRIVHDAEERQLYFDDAQFQVLGVPIFYMPRMRLPDPTLERATGVLIPTVETSSLLGNGVTVPYFFVLGDHADLTLTPRITTRSRTLDIRYRRAFRSGEIDWTSYVSKDEVTNDDFQFGVLADGRFDLARGFELAFDIETESRRGYLSDYDYSSKDRLDSAISLSRTRARDVSFIELVGLRSIRDGENDDTFPELLVEARHALRVGDRGLLELDYASYSRGSDSAEDVDGDGIADGLDRARFGATFDWRRSEVLRFGVIFEAKAEAAADLFLLSDDPAF